MKVETPETHRSWYASARRSYLYNILQHNTSPGALYTIVCLEAS